MAAPVSWRIKGINKITRQMASDAAARSGVSVGEWLERAINKNVHVLPPEKDQPLVSAELLDSARGQVTDENLEEPAAAVVEDDEQAELPLLSASPKERPLRVPNVAPTLIASTSRRPAGNLPRFIGGLLIVVLIAGAYWLVDQNAKNKLTAENDAAAGRSVTASRATDSGAGNQGQSRRTESSENPAVLTPLQKLTELAKSGDSRAQHDLGLRYVQGNGVARDAKQGAQWLQKSAATGMPKAQYHIGLLYQKGLGVSANMKTAYQWYRKAAQQGHVRAQYNLGTLYADGKGIKRNYTEAARWFSRASRGGLAEAHYSLGLLYENGLGVERDQRKAAAYYRSALAAGSAQAAEKLTRLEPALKELSASVEPTLLETNVAAAGSDGQSASTQNRALSAAGIKNLQRLLKKLDLEPGPPDGVLGDRTIEAIRLYQRFAGLPVDGKPTLELLLDLRQVVDAMSGERPAASAPTGVR